MGADAKKLIFGFANHAMTQSGLTKQAIAAVRKLVLKTAPSAS